MAKTWKHNGLEIQLTPLHVIPTIHKNGRRRIWMLSKSFRLIIRGEGICETLNVPAGFETDFATLPVFTQILLGNRDDYAEVAVFHDWLCANHAPRVFANAHMRFLMLAMGYPWWKTFLVWVGLQVFGYRSPVSNLWGRLRSFLKLKT